MMKSLRNLVLFGNIVLGSWSCSEVQPKPWGKAAGYYDTRGMPSASLTGGVNDLPLGADFFGFIDDYSEENHWDDVQNPYAEFKLYKKATLGSVDSVLGKSVGPAVQYDRDFSLKQGITRLGLTFEPNLSEYIGGDSLVGANVYPFSSENGGVQLGVYAVDYFFNDLFCYDGFFDYDVNPQDGKPKIVSEIQAGVRIWKNVYGVVEGRYNEYLDDKFGAGIGLELLLRD